MFLDIGVGILSTFLVGNIFGIDPANELFIFGIIFALLPDVDMLLLSLSKETWIYKFFKGHRGLSHYPFIYTLLTPIVFLFFGKIIGTLFVFGVFWHLFHDTVVLGGGIKWGWPFSERSYRFFPDRNGKITNTFLLTWLPHEEEQVTGLYGSPNWVKDFYLTINPISIVEYSVFFVAIYLLISK